MSRFISVYAESLAIDPRIRIFPPCGALFDFRAHFCHSAPPMETHAMSDSPSYPGMIMVIRHGEKPGASGDDKGGGPHLSIRGSARAAALPLLFIPGGTPAADEQQLCCEIARVIRPRPSPGSCSQVLGTYTFGTVPAAASRFPTPQYLFATASSSDSSRPLETVTPVAQALLSLNDPAIDATINSSFGNKSHEMQTLVSTLLKTSATYAGKVILICWHHGTIPELVEDFGVPKEQLKGWDPFPSSVFDVVMQITWSGTQANLEVRHQKLLFGDTQ